jgi:hypothetical protein
VLASGIGLAAAGALAVCFLPVAPYWRVLLASAWGALAAFELVRLRRRSAPVSAYRVYADGSVDLLQADGASAGRLMPGSVLYERVGWLRVAAVDGGAWGELVAGNCRKNKGWRRLQVIFRHRSA